MLSWTALLLVPAVSASAFVAPLATRQSACADTHIFLGKGNNEQVPGRQGKLVNAICSGLASCDYEDIQFLNAANTPYCQSITEGGINGQAQILAYNQRCPNSKLVVSGYSQGAQVVGDIIGGGGGTFFQDCVVQPRAGIDPNSPAGRQIAAVLTFGDTRHTAFQPYNQLTGANKNGIFPRPANQLAGLNAYASIYHDYCVETDPICAGGSVGETHTNYFDIYTDQAAAFVRSLLAAPRPTLAPTSSASIVSTTASVSTSIARPSNGTVVFVPTYSLRPTSVAVPLATSVPAAVTATMGNGEVVIATQVSNVGQYTSNIVIPSATATEAVTVESAAVPTAILTSVSYPAQASGVATGTSPGTGNPSAGSPSSGASAVPTFDPANSAMSVSGGAASVVVGLVLGAVMAFM